MSYRTLLGLAAVVLFAAAASSIDTPLVAWQPPWPVRIGLGVAGVLLALGALLFKGSKQDA